MGLCSFCKFCNVCIVAAGRKPMTQVMIMLNNKTSLKPDVDLRIIADI